MEEADRILLDTIRSIGCELGADLNRINQLNQDLFVECVARLLNTIIPNENFPSKLPPTTGIKYRICTKFASSCQQLGYKNEIGYQTFLYSNEHDMRRLLMFLVEKLPKDYSQIQSEDLNIPKERLFQQKVSQKINLMVSQFWVPFYCKSKGLRYLNENLYIKEGVQCLKEFHTNHQSTPTNYLNGKAKYNKDQLQYFSDHCDLITKQTIGDSSRVLSSIIQRNTIDKIKEQELFKDKQKKNDNLSRIKQAIRKSLENELTKSNQVLTNDDIAEIEGIFKRAESNLTSQKGSRFALSENLQFKNESDDVTVGLPGTNEEKKEEEIRQLKENFENLTKNLTELSHHIQKLNFFIEKIEEECESQTQLNKKLDENYQIRKKTVGLIQDAPNNIIKLIEDIDNFDNKMKNLENQWISVKEPLEKEKESIKNELNEKKNQMQIKISGINTLKEQLNALSVELKRKDDEIKDLTKDFEAIPSNKDTNNRQFYTKRILEIVSNIDRQKREIEKILIETKTIQKDINQLSGKLERIFTATDELVFKNAKKDESYKRAYKLFININEQYELLMKSIEETSVFVREIRDLEDQVDQENQTSVNESMKRLLNDYKQIKEENDQLTKSLKQK